MTLKVLFEQNIQLTSNAPLFPQTLVVTMAHQLMAAATIDSQVQ
jgi:hypothetical protein